MSAFRDGPVTDEQDAAVSHIRMRAGQLEFAILTSAPRNRELAIAMTKLEECVMWATKGMSR